MIFDIAGNVPADQVDLIKQGLALAESYFDRVLGGGIPDDVQAGITVKIVNTGLGNTEPGGGGGVATAFSEDGIRPFFDVGHEQWIQHLEGFGLSVEDHILHTVAHEWAHGWQSYLGALDIHHQPLGNAFNEGIAEFLAYAVLEDAGMLTKPVVDPFMLNGAYQSHELDNPIRDVENSVWSGHAGYLAIDWLVGDAPTGLMSLRLLATEIGRGQSIADAFRTAFNIELEDFYTQFEAWRQIIVADPEHGYANRPALINIGDGSYGETPGDDVLKGGPLGDVISALAGNDKVSGDAGNDQLMGDAGKDTLLGGSGKDTLAGGLGKDELTGNGGKDVFLFDTKLGAKNVDIITDFKAKDDTIWLDKDVFTKLGALGTLKIAAFAANSSGHAESTKDRIVYETDTGKLRYDADGSKSGAAIHFATLDEHLDLTHADFVIV